jgi:hypothetical protein
LAPFLALADALDAPEFAREIAVGRLADALGQAGAEPPAERLRVAFDDSTNQMDGRVLGACLSDGR